MEYLFKPDWATTKQKFLEYWARENHDRCLLNVKAVKDKAVHDPKWGPADPNLTLEQRWLDAERIVNDYENFFSHTYFAAESLPIVNVNLGPGVTAAYLGCNYQLNTNTVWFQPFIEDWDQDQFSFHETSMLWQKTLEITSLAVQRGQGKYFVNQTDLSGTIDILVHMRGTENLLFDFIDFPDEVKAARDRVLEIWFSCLKRLYELIRQGNDGGSLSWLDVWSPGLCHALQCDFSAMISPAHFEEFVMPEIRRQCQEMPYSIFHLDGPGVAVHLDHLLSIPELNAIQWQPGSGQARPVEWRDLLKKIQNSGKCIHTWGSCQDVLDMMEYLSPEGVYIEVLDTLNSPEEAESFLREVERKCRK